MIQIEEYRMVSNYLFCVVNAKNCLANMKELFQIGFIKRLSQMMAKLSLNLKMMHFPIFYCLLLGE
ncbi:hypothetical protein CGS46_05330 [Faecalibacterium langellae]|uniref:Uncharacterized protein n=1 Tax=Faecalibacterium langellae TaxID=3435293 RepID=A0A2A6ZC48_9FIRM|nr:hypothetical protein CGS46_05330 [Faecalibacterium prausnitzii]